jgi:hypothetical protein
MEALVHAAPRAVQLPGGKDSAASRYPEFRAWHALIEPLFGIEAPDWTEPDEGILSFDDLLPAAGGIDEEPDDEGGDEDEQDEDEEDSDA